MNVRSATIDERAFVVNDRSLTTAARSSNNPELISSDAPTIKIGVLALQGAYIEHISSLNKIGGVNAVAIRTANELQGCDGLVIPGGESTSMTILLDKPLENALNEYFFVQRRPVWGTCAGMILLAKQVTNGISGQFSFKAMDIVVERNFFGSQKMSFATELIPKSRHRSRNNRTSNDAAETSSSTGNDENYCLNASVDTNDVPVKFETHILCDSKFPLPSIRALFIRAPIVTELLSDNVHVLAEIYSPSHPHRKQPVIVAVEQNNFVATSFHPELTDDISWQRWWINAKVRPSLIKDPTI